MPIQKRIELTGHAGSIYTLDWIDHFVFTGSGDKFVAKWNLLTGTQEAFSIKCDQAVYKIKLLRNKTLLAIGTSSGSLHLIDLIQKKELKHYIQHQTAIFEIVENPAKNQYYTADSDGNLAIWNLESLDLLLFLPLMTGKIRMIQTSEDGSIIYLACQDGFIRSFDTQHFNELFSIKAHETGVNCLYFFPLKKHLLVSGGKDGFLRIWNTVENNSLLLEIPAHNFGIYQIDFFNEGTNFVTVSRDKSIKLWDAVSLKVIQKIERKHGGHSHAINAIAKLNEQEFVTVGDDKRIIYWEFVN